MAELGLNVFQVLQNELISREGNRSTLGLGYRLHIIEERVKNAEAISRNGRVWRPHHALHPISAPSLSSRKASERERRKLLDRQGAKGDKDIKDPSKHVREETWVVQEYFPRTVLEFKELQLFPDHLRDLLEFYEVKVYRPDLRSVSLDLADKLYDVRSNMEVCLEEFAASVGLDWQKIGGLTLPSR